MNKKQLDKLATIIGLIGGIATVLATQDVVNPKIALTIAGISQVFLGYIANRQPDKDKNNGNFGIYNATDR